MKHLVAILALTGCDQVLGLQSTRPSDAFVADAPDTDGDGIADDIDNCINAPNPLQEDFDGDLVGDVCDNCPLVGNSQNDDYDHDGVGDACDPNPKLAGDCILVVDRFGDRTQFATNWKIYSSGTDTVGVNAGKITFPPTGKTLAMLSAATFPTAAINGVHVHAIKSVPDDGEFGIAHPTDTTFVDGDECAVAIDTAGTNRPTLYERQISGSLQDPDPLSSEPLPGPLLMRHEAPVFAGGGLGAPASCRLDYGFAVGTARITVPPNSSTYYGPYVKAIASAIDVDAIVIYGEASVCPARIMR